MENASIQIEGTPCYFARPQGDVKGGLIVIHEVWGLLDHIKDVANRFAREGYMVVAPDLLFGTPLHGVVDPQMMARMTNPATRDETQKELRSAMAPLQSPEFGKNTVEKLKHIFAWLGEQPETGGKLASVGFCFGGTYSYAMAMAEPKLLAAVPFYGHASKALDDLKQITCPILAFYGEQDTRLVDDLPELTERMKEANVTFRSVVYPMTGHAFFNDTNPNAYREGPAQDAWEQTKTFLAERFSTRSQ